MKHVVQAIAQFKQGLKHRRSSMYSNSESEFDRISRASTDSFLDDFIPLADRADMVMNKEHMVATESPNCEERVSTGVCR